MSFFRTLAYLSPFAVGFGVAAALALTAGRPPRQRAVAAGGVAGGVLGLLLLASFTDSPKQWLPLALLLGSFAVMIAGLYLLGEALRAPREVSQIVSGLVVCLLMSTVFVFGPIIRNSADTGATGEAISRRIALMMDVSPLMVMGESIFAEDLLHKPYIYRLDLAGYQHPDPSWAASSAGYALAGAALAGLAVALRRLFRGKTP
jgi:hypothetical protein